MTTYPVTSNILPSLNDNHMQELIAAKALPLGSTEPGKAWCIKALHPSDPVMTTTGIPDPTSLPTVHQNYQFSYSACPAHAVQPWSFDLFLYANPIIPAVVALHGATEEVYPLFNPHLAGASGANVDAINETMVTAFASNVRRYRMTYYGATGHLDCPKMYEKGYIACAQYPITASTLNFHPQIDAVDARFTRPITTFTDTTPTTAELQTLPNAYYNLATAGIYAPFRLTESFQDWKNTGDATWLINKVDAAAAVVTSGVDDYGNVTSIAPHATVPVSYQLPYGLNGTSLNADGSFNVCTVLPRCDDNVVHIAGWNLDPTAHFQFYFRIGYEYCVPCASPMSCQARTSPPYDSRAIESYYLISRELADAYPASYNDFGSILSTIADVASSILPTIFPAAGPILAGIRTLFKGKKKEDAPPSAAKVEQARERITQPVVVIRANKSKGNNNNAVVVRNGNKRTNRRTRKQLQ